MIRILLLALMLAAVAACQPLPRPFSDDRPPPGAPILTLPDSAGVTVAPVAGAPPGTAEKLADAMAEALRQAQVPASTQGGNRGSARLVGTAEEQAAGDGRSRIAVRWELFGPSGDSLGSHRAEREAATADWRGGEPQLMADLGKEAAPAVAALIQEEAPTAAENGGKPRLVLRQVAGAPGDGSRALTRAMASALRKAEYGVLLQPGGGRELTVAGTVTMTPPAAGQQKVTIVWAVLAPDGRRLGEVKQENAVPAGSLDGPWGDVAYVVANAAAEGIVALVEHVGAAAAS